MAVPAGNFLPHRPLPRLLEEEQEEGLTKENDELITRCSRNLLNGDEGNDEGDQIDRLDQRKGENKKEKDWKVISGTNMTKMQAKSKQFLLSRLSRFNKQLETTKNKTEAATTRRSAPPFPYNGEDFGGSPSRYVCFLRPSNPPFPSSPMHTATVNSPNPKNSSYYDFAKSLIEKNDFYSPECNAHREIPSSQHK